MATTIFTRTTSVFKHLLATQPQSCANKLAQSGCIMGLHDRNMSTARKDELYRQLTIELKGHDRPVLSSYQKFTEMAAKELDVHIAKIYEPPKIYTRSTLLKSVFIYKRHFHQYETRTLFTVFEIKHITGSTADTFLEYIQRNIPEGVAMKVTKHKLEKFPEYLKPTTAEVSSSESTVVKLTSGDSTSARGEGETIAKVNDDGTTEDGKQAEVSQGVKTKDGTAAKVSQDTTIKVDTAAKVSQDTTSKVGTAARVRKSSTPKTEKSTKSKAEKNITNSEDSSVKRSSDALNGAEGVKT